LAEYAGISLPYLTDIERCKTWVSDKTLQKLAKALNKEPWELLVFKEEESSQNDQKFSDDKRNQACQIADVITKKKEALRHVVNKTMEELIMEIIQKK